MKPSIVRLFSATVVFGASLAITSGVMAQVICTLCNPTPPPNLPQSERAQIFSANQRSATTPQQRQAQGKAFGASTSQAAQNKGASATDGAAATNSSQGWLPGQGDSFLYGPGR
jgi:hypothetical protein